jgi:glyoxylase-like metal-dependent hydrolase (beta-lactamase superfamily II)
MKIISLHLLIASVGLMSTSVPAQAQGPVETAPASRSFNVGAMQVTVLRAGRLAIPNDGSVFATNARPAEVAKLLRAAGQPAQTINLDIDVLLVRTGGRTVLIDTGYGAKNKSVLERSLRSVGVSPRDVTDILITHSHPDHVGGLVDAKGRPAFPNALVHMSANEWRAMQESPDARGIAEAIRPRVRTFVPGGLVVPGIRSKALYGHTPGHVMYELASRGERLLDIGDAAHSSVISLERPEWTIAWDSDKLRGVAQRRSQLRLLSASKERIFAVHFPFPGVGTIVRRGSGFAFDPGVPRR